MNGQSGYSLNQQNKGLNVDPDALCEELRKTKKAKIYHESKHVAIMFAGDMVYKALNPESKMDTPSSVYERLEKQYDDWSKKQQ